MIEYFIRLFVSMQEETVFLRQMYVAKHDVMNLFHFIRNHRQGRSHRVPRKQSRECDLSE